ncbi:Pyridoxal-dependent decarboxylase [Catenulispora acidiphila DSM 44928]|uniref:Pyridoxal-dependent decarboxylase n=1 Tax=Catenulispora acidiphila (strain DSM 44928 / JCM 14897 / NBRC 102108 / NRRL B-24433 / ID139908) TaxID=479433 RepID=C7QD18_CATAD|nr:pyridoxal-dependent decarboxylase [Catenulispora acidiphila]ACU70728.1 Pyridoxal-dependent decarboxylase [Catenulispora acidiphila DSM 44928]
MSEHINEDPSTAPHPPTRPGAPVDIGEMSGIEADVLRGVLRAEPVGHLATTNTAATQDATGLAMSITANQAANLGALPATQADRRTPQSLASADLATAGLVSAGSLATSQIAELGAAPDTQVDRRMQQSLAIADLANPGSLAANQIAELSTAPAPPLAHLAPPNLTAAEPNSDLASPSNLAPTPEPPLSHLAPPADLTNPGSPAANQIAELSTAPAPPLAHLAPPNFTAVEPNSNLLSPGSLAPTPEPPLADLASPSPPAFELAGGSAGAIAATLAAHAGAPAVDAAALASGPAGTGALALFLATVLDGLDRGRADWLGPLPPGGPQAVRDAVAASGFGVLPDKGQDPFETLASLGRLLAWGSADPAHPHCAAHLHCPPLATSVAAETAVAALNQSLDSWDQSPAAGEIEERVVRTLTRAVGYSGSSAGVLTSGGTESNLMGLLLARDDVLRRRFDADPDLDGVPPFAAGRLRIVASEQAHFSIARNAAILGLGERCVVPVASDAVGRMRLDALAEALDAVAERDEIALAVVATAGTTDLGAIDPLAPIGKLAARHGAWFHVDAAYGGGLLLGSDPDARLLGLDAADSVTLDLHKLGWQPVPAGCFLVKRAASLRTLEKRVSYLNSVDDEQAGYPSLLGRSLRTTRRADAVKLAAAFQALGREGFQQLIDRCLALTRYAAAAVRQHADLELTAEPQLTTVLFRYLPPDLRDTDRVNGVLRRHLLEAGRAVLGRTELARERPGTPPGRVRLKLTLLNPHTTEHQIDALLAAVRAAGGAASSSSAFVRGPS